MAEPPSYEVLRVAPQDGLVKEVCPACGKAYVYVDLPEGFPRGRFIACECGVVYEDAKGRRG